MVYTTFMCFNSLTDIIHNRQNRLSKLKHNVLNSQYWNVMFSWVCNKISSLHFLRTTLTKYMIHDNCSATRVQRLGCMFLISASTLKISTRQAQWEDHYTPPPEWQNNFAELTQWEDHHSVPSKWLNNFHGL